MGEGDGCALKASRARGDNGAAILRMDVREISLSRKQRSPRIELGRGGRWGFRLIATSKLVASGLCRLLSGFPFSLFSEGNPSSLQES